MLRFFENFDFEEEILKKKMKILEIFGNFQNFENRR